MTGPRKKLETVYWARGKWFLDYIDFDGKNRRKTLKSANGNYPKNKTEAKEFADQFLLKLRTMQQLSSEEEYLHRVAEHKNLILRYKFTLDDVLGILQNNPKLKSGTRLQTRCYQWAKFYDWLKIHYAIVKAPYEVTPLMAEEFFSTLYAEGMANATYNDYVTSFRLIFNIIMPHCGLTSNPFDVVQRLPKNTISHQPITPEYIEKIIAACDDTNFHVLETRSLPPISAAELKTLIMLGLCTGMRLKDCALLQWESVDFNSHYIQTVAYKTKRYDRGMLWIPMMEPLEKHLKSIHTDHQYGFVMPLIASRYLDDERKTKYNKTKTDCGNLSNEVRNLLQYVGLPVSQRLTKKEMEHGITKKFANRKKSPNLYGFHSFRHYFISTCAECNIPMAYVEAIIGDTSSVIKNITLTSIVMICLEPLAEYNPKSLAVQQISHHHTEFVQ